MTRHAVFWIYARAPHAFCMPKYRVNPVLPRATVRQSPLLLTPVTRSLYLWELWKILASTPSPRRLLLLVINQLHERKEDSLPACDVNAWGMALHCWLVTSSAGLSVMISLPRAHPEPHLGHTRKTHLFRTIIQHTRQWLLVQTREEETNAPSSSCVVHCPPRDSASWVSSVPEALTACSSTQMRTWGTLWRVLHISHGPNQKLSFPLFFRGLKATDITGYKAAEQMWTPISSLGKQEQE